MVESLHPDLMVLDLMMPQDVGAWTCAAQIRQNSAIAHHHAHRQGRGNRPHTRPGAGRGRLHRQALQPPRGAGAHQGGAAPLLAKSRSDEDSSIIRLPQLEISLENYQVKAAGKVIPCTPKEVEILHMLCSNVGQVFSREQILSPRMGLRLLWRHPHRGRAHQAHPPEAAAGERAVGAEDGIRRGLSL